MHSNPRSRRARARTAAGSSRFRPLLPRMQERFLPYSGIRRATALKMAFVRGTTIPWTASGKLSLSNFSRRYCARFIFFTNFFTKRAPSYFPAIRSAKSAAIGTRKRSC
jgi:hypothetical protein